MQTFGQIADKITVSGEQKILGKVNLNTAPREVLVALFGGDEQAEQLAHTVMANRSSLMYGFQSIAELARPAVHDVGEVQGHRRAGHRSLGRLHDPVLCDGPDRAARGRRRNVWWTGVRRRARFSTGIREPTTDDE